MDVLTSWLAHSTPDHHSQHAPCAEYTRIGEGSHLPILNVSSQDEQNEMIQFLCADSGGQWHGKIKEQFY